jgi:ribosome-associated translation inhibitor RaiA
VERFNIRKQNDVEVKEQYQDKVSNRFVALENLDDDIDDVYIRMSWEITRENIKTSAADRLGY